MSNTVSTPPPDWDELSLHLWRTYDDFGTVNGVGWGATGPMVYFESLNDGEKLEDIPNTFGAYTVMLGVVGKIVAQKEQL